MNTETVKNEIQKIITENRNRIGGKAARKQYAPGKAQIAELTMMGIVGLMPKGYGFADASAVLSEAKQSKTAVMNRAGEGEEIAASVLYTLLNQ